MSVNEYPSGPDLQTITAELNARASSHPIGALQELRAKRKGLSRRPGSKIFSSLTTFEDWAFHHGGRTELQFNIGLEEIDGRTHFRYGVAFSFETSRSLPDVNVLLPQAKRFNEYLRINPDAFADLRMWSFRGDQRSLDSMPGPIPHELLTEGVFVFLGKHEPVEQIDYDAILGLFDRLLPLYEYVEGSAATPLLATPGEFTFRPGCTSKPGGTTATPAQRVLDVSLRHNKLQEALHDRLAAQHGSANVGTEIPTGIGGKIDVVVRRDAEFWFYEIKTNGSAQACLREAIGQLLEYAFWPGTRQATRLIVVGETSADSATKEYVRNLRDRFQLPIEYEHITVQAGGKRGRTR